MTANNVSPIVATAATPRVPQPFVVTTPAGVRIVVAKSAAQALRHVIEPVYKATRATVADIVAHSALPIEVAGESPEE
jgi:hypothetical protein